MPKSAADHSDEGSDMNDEGEEGEEGSDDDDDDEGEGSDEWFKTTWIASYFWDKNLFKSQISYHMRSPLILLASCMSLGMMVTRFAWIAHRLVSSNRPTMYASAASYRARTACDWNLRSDLNS